MAELNIHERKIYSFLYFYYILYTSKCMFVQWIWMKGTRHALIMKGKPSISWLTLLSAWLDAVGEGAATSGVNASLLCCLSCQTCHWSNIALVGTWLSNGQETDLKPCDAQSFRVMVVTRHPWESEESLFNPGPLTVTVLFGWDRCR